jgi:hypothetical protein
MDDAISSVLLPRENFKFQTRFKKNSKRCTRKSWFRTIFAVVVVDGGYCHMLSPYIFRGNVASSQVAYSLLRRSTPRRIVPTTATGSVQLRWNTNGNVILACCRPLKVSAARVVLANQDAVTKMMLSSSSDNLLQQGDSAVPGVVEQTVREKLTKALDPLTHLTILNESHRHNVYVL